MVHPAGIAQLVEHDLAKVGVEGPSPFSRSKIKEPLSEWFFYFLCWHGSDFRPLGVEGAAKFGSCTKCEEANFALDTNAVSASPKGQKPAAQRGLDFDNPFSRSKTKSLASS